MEASQPLARQSWKSWARFLVVVGVESGFGGGESGES